MACKVCEGGVLEYRCSECGRLPKDPQLAILSEAYDTLQFLSGVRVSEPEMLRVLKILTGVVTRLVKETNHLRYAPFGVRKGVPRHHTDCSIHDPPHDHCDCIIDRQPIHSRP